MSATTVCSRCGQDRTPASRSFSPDLCLPCLNAPERIPEAAEAYLKTWLEGGVA